MQRKLSKNANVTISVLLISMGLFLISFNYFSKIKNNLFNEKNIQLIEQKIVMNEIVDEIDDLTEDEHIYDVDINEYIGYLEIPKIELKRGFLSPESVYNSIQYNVAVMPKSKMPTEKYGNLILAAHRGNSSVSFFDKLYLLELNDKALIYYHGKIYTYKLVNVYKEPKDGVLTIRRDGEKNVLTLVTCSKEDKSSQLVFIFELEKIEREGK